MQFESEKPLPSSNVRQPPASQLSYICLDSLESEIEEEILSKDGLCSVQMLGAMSNNMLDDEVLKNADIVALWHTIQLDRILLHRLKKPPKVSINLTITPLRFPCT